MSLSHIPSTSTSTSNFRSIFNAALKAYEKKTKKDLLAHPLAAQFQACNSPDDILFVLQNKVAEFDQSRSERLSRWLSPTINVLYAFSATLGGGIGLVGPIFQPDYANTLSTITSQIFSPANVIFAGVGVLLSVSTVFDLSLEVILTPKPVTGS